MKSLPGISTISIELTSRCNKDCWMCGRRELEKKDPDYASKQGDMDLIMVIKIADQIPSGTVVQLHWNGEPMVYPWIERVAKIFKRRGCYVCMNTNGFLIGDDHRKLTHFDSVAVSLIQDDKQKSYDRQFVQLLWFFREMDEHTRPLIVFRALGHVPTKFRSFLSHKKTVWVDRVLHAKEMSRDYEKEPTKPEIGVCLDLLNHPAIDKDGDVYPCVRMNPDGISFLGRIGECSLSEILNGEERKGMIRLHFEGRRNIIPLCNDCHYYGVPTGRG